MVQMAGYGMIASGVVGVAKIALPKLGLGNISESIGDFYVAEDSMNGPLALAGPDMSGSVALAGFRDDAFNRDLMAA